MTKMELIKILEQFDDDAPILIYDPETAYLGDICDVSDNNGALQLTLDSMEECDED